MHAVIAVYGYHLRGGEKAPTPRNPIWNGAPWWVLTTRGEDDKPVRVLSVLARTCMLMLATGHVGWGGTRAADRLWVNPHSSSFLPPPPRPRPPIPLRPYRTGVEGGRFACSCLGLFGVASGVLCDFGLGYCGVSAFYALWLCACQPDAVSACVLARAMALLNSSVSLWLPDWSIVMMLLYA